MKVTIKKRRNRLLVPFACAPYAAPAFPLLAPPGFLLLEFRLVLVRNNFGCDKP